MRLVRLERCLTYLHGATILTPYNGQRALYLTMLRDLQISTSLGYNMLPE
jgi:hypothetical protein